MPYQTVCVDVVFFHVSPGIIYLSWWYCFVLLRYSCGITMYYEPCIPGNLGNSHSSALGSANGRKNISETPDLAGHLLHPNVTTFNVHIAQLLKLGG